MHSKNFKHFHIICGNKIIYDNAITYFGLLPISKGSLSFHSIDCTLPGLSHLFISHLFSGVDCKNKPSVHILFIKNQHLVQTAHIYISNQMTQCLWKSQYDYILKLDWLGPDDNRPSTNKLHHFEEEKNVTPDMWHVEGGEHVLKISISSSYGLGVKVFWK